MLAYARQPVAVLDSVSRTIRTTHTNYNNSRLVVRVEVDVYRFWDSCQTRLSKQPEVGKPRLRGAPGPFRP